MIITHEELVSKLMKTGEVLMGEMTPFKALMFNAGMSIGGEVGELQDCIKKHTCYNQELNLNNLVEELGDIEFYLEVIRTATGIKRETTLVFNISKLSERYEGITYSDRAAKERKDKVTTSNYPI